MAASELLAGLTSIAISAGKKAVEWAGTDDGKVFLCGRYTDGTPRSFGDMWNDEIMSPKTRKKRIKQMEKRKRDLEDLIFSQKNGGKKKKSKKKKGKKKKSKRDFPTSWY